MYVQYKESHSHVCITVLVLILLLEFTIISADSYHEPLYIFMINATEIQTRDTLAISKTYILSGVKSNSLLTDFSSLNFFSSLAISLVGDDAIALLLSRDLVVDMASGSPTVHSRLKAAHSPMTHSRHFVEDSPRTRIELARNNLVMQKELVKIEKQAKTAAMNVSNNQQALRMSLRQLESKRSSHSPLLTHSPVMDKKDSNASKRKLGLFANNTSLSVESTADAYKNSAAAITGGRARSRSTSEHRLLHDSERASAENGRIVATQIVINPAADNGEEDGPVFRPAVSTAPAVQHNAADHQSPYISTPLNVRRVKLSKPFHSLSASQHLPVRTTAVKDHNRPATQEAPLSQSCHTIHSLYNKPCNVSGDSDELNHRRGSLKLPPINATRTIISAHHNTTGNQYSFTQLLWLLIYTFL